MDDDNDSRQQDEAARAADDRDWATFRVVQAMQDMVSHPNEREWLLAMSEIINNRLENLK